MVTKDVMVAQLVIARLSNDDPELVGQLSDKSDAYGLSLFEYVRRRVEWRMKHGRARGSDQGGRRADARDG